MLMSQKIFNLFCFNNLKLLFDSSITQAGKVRKMPHEQNKDENSIGGNLRIIVLIAVLFILLLFAVHCTWVTSNAYSSPSVVLATYDQSGR